MKTTSKFKSKFISKLQGINAVCDPQFKDFYKIESKTFTFCTSPISRACPVWLAPKVTKNLSQNISFHFHFFLQIQPKIIPDFWLRWLFPPNQLVLFICFEKKGRVWTPGHFRKTRTKTNLKVLQEDDQYWSLLHHRVLPLIAMTNFICTFCSLTWKYISLSL